MLTQVRWNKVRIDPATLIVDQQDFTYAAVVSGNDRRAIGFGTAVDALPGWYEGPRTFIKANVDLRGTDFHMDGVFTHVTGTLTGDAGISFPTPSKPRSPHLSVEALASAVTSSTRASSGSRSTTRPGCPLGSGQAPHGACSLPAPPRRRALP
ncbi:hypothetical protein ACFP9V_21595 [Deinococcus radiopugnans]|uniref:hypothetical protein n=1 Tax=Deinococcus radiopugnans TaxID=57497 RepID=UPI00361FC796